MLCDNCLLETVLLSAARIVLVVISPSDFLSTGKLPLFHRSGRTRGLDVSVACESHVAELVASICGPGTDADRDQRRDRRDDVDDAFQCVGVEGDAAGRPVGEIFDAHDQQCHGNAGHGHSARVGDGAGHGVTRLPVRDRAAGRLKRRTLNATHAWVDLKVAFKVQRRFGVIAF